MKKSKTKTNLGLFGLLVISLSMSQGWADNTGNIQSRDLASEATVSGNTVFWDMDVEYKEGNKKVERVIKVTGQTELITVLTPVKKNGVWTNKEETKQRFKAKFSDTNCSSSNCVTAIAPLLVADQDNIEALKAAVKAAYDEQLTIELVRKKELELMQGDLVKREKDAKACKKIIVDRDDKEKDITLSRSKNKKQWFECRRVAFEAEDYEDEDEKYEAFKDEFGDDIEALALSNDKNADDILDAFADSIDSRQAEQYMAGMKIVNEDYQYALELAEDGDMSGVNRVTQFYGLGQYRYLTKTKSWGPFYSSRTVPRNASQVDAFDSIRRDLIRKMNIAMRGPEDLINDGRRSDMESNSAGRGYRARNSSYRMPQFDFDNLLVDRNNSYNGRTQNNNNSNVRNGQYVPRWQQSNNQRSNNNYQRGNNQRGQYQRGQQRSFPTQNQNFNRRRFS